MCVQNLNDSRGLAIRITYRISLRSSSLWEPRHPSLKVVSSKFHFFPVGDTPQHGGMSPSPLPLDLQVITSQLQNGPPHSLMTDPSNRPGKTQQRHIHTQPKAKVILFECMAVSSASSFTTAKHEATTQLQLQFTTAPSPTPPRVNPKTISIRLAALASTTLHTTTSHRYAEAASSSRRQPNHFRKMGDPGSVW